MVPAAGLVVGSWTILEVVKGKQRPGFNVILECVCGKVKHWSWYRFSQLKRGHCGCLPSPEIKRPKPSRVKTRPCLNTSCDNPATVSARYCERCKGLCHDCFKEPPKPSTPNWRYSFCKTCTDKRTAPKRRLLTQAWNARRKQLRELAAQTEPPKHQPCDHCGEPAYRPSPRAIKKYCEACNTLCHSCWEKPKNGTRDCLSCTAKYQEQRRREKGVPTRNWCPHENAPRYESNNACVLCLKDRMRQRVLARNPNARKLEYRTCRCTGTPRALKKCVKCTKRMNAAWYSENKDAAAVKSAAYAKTHPEVCKKARLAYYARHPERIKARKNLERARRLKAPGSFTAAQWRAVVTAQISCCAACGDKTKMTADHIIPLIRGGTNWAWNLQGLCLNCNCRKRDSIDFQLLAPMISGSLGAEKLIEWLHTSEAGQKIVELWASQGHVLDSVGLGGVERSQNPLTSPPYL